MKVEDERAKCGFDSYTGDIVGGIGLGAVTSHPETGAELLARIQARRYAILGMTPSSARSNRRPGPSVNDMLPPLPDGWVSSGQIPRCVFQNRVFRARLYLPGSMEPKFISWYANAFGQGYFIAKGKQTTNLASINKTMLSAFPVPVAPLAQQKHIVAEIEKK